MVMLFWNCERNETVEIPDKKYVELNTDKNSYLNLQDIAFNLCNNSHDNLSYLGCWFSNSPVIELEKYINEEWVVEHYTLCVEYSWHQLHSGQEIADTIRSNWFDTGSYRMKCNLMIDSLETIVYSNVFEINNEKDIEFYTDKSIYGNDEKIAICFRNNTVLGLHVNWCRLFYKERFENGTWQCTGGPPCPFDGSFYYIPPESIINDTIISKWLGNGRYRLVTYNIQTDSITISVHSNEFLIVNIENLMYQNK